MSLFDAGFLFLTAVLAGALNSVAGGGSFLTFPALVFTGVSDIPANITNKIALWPGAMSGAAAYRRELNLASASLRSLVPATLAGTVLGALLLLSIDPLIFRLILPYLLLIATLLFAMSERINAWAYAHRSGSQQHMHWALLAFLQFFIAIYGGFFGGGIGILMLALLSISGMDHIHTMNALKNLLGSIINGASVLTFLIQDLFAWWAGIPGSIAWPQGIVMIIGAVIGGYAGGSFTRTLNPKLVRQAVVIIGFIITILFFLRS